jgi:WS/DGAT/MGAT family acyltransferase
MDNVDNFWLCMDDPTNLMVITGFMELEEVPSMERLKATLEHRLLCFDRFKRRIQRPLSGVGVPDWEEDAHFDIRSHLHRVALPEPGDRKALQEMVGDLMSVPLDQTKPLWQAHMIENYGTGCAVFFRIHHCIADGISLIQVLLSMTDSVEDAPWPQPKCQNEDKQPSGSRLPFASVIRGVKGAIRTTRSLGKKLTDEVAGTISNPFHLIELTRTGAGLAVDTASVLAKLALLPPHPANSFRGKLGVQKCAAWTEPISLGNIKTVGRVVEATLNDVLIATVTGALRRYLKRRNDKVNELELQVTVPVNIRKPGTELELGNKFSLVWLALPVHIEDPILRLREVKRRMDKLKHAPDAFVGFSILNALGMSPAKVAKKAAHMFANKSSAVLTNVPGPRKPLYFSGKKVSNMMFWVPRAGRVGLGISILSYDGKVTVGLATDAGLVPDPEKILEGFEEDFNYLLDLVKSGKVFADPLVINDRYEEARARLEAEEAELPKCIALTKSGRQCRKNAVLGSDYCPIHQNYEPEQSEAKTEADDEEEEKVYIPPHQSDISHQPAEMTMKEMGE